MVNGRRFVILVACGLGLVWYMGLGSDKRIELIKTIKAKAPTAILRHSEPAQNISVLTFPKPIKSAKPATKFRDNLLDDNRFIYASHAFGLSEQFIQLCKVVTLGHRMDRTPLFDNLYPEHKEGSRPLVSDFFDFIPAVNRLNLSLVEFADLKTTDLALSEPEELSGWAAFGPSALGKGGIKEYNIKTSFWPIPPVLSFYPTMATIELLGQRPPFDWIEENRERVWEKLMQEMPNEPDEVVLTLDQTFFIREARWQDGKVNVNESLELVDPDSFTWKEVGQYVRFQPWVEHLADDFLTAVFTRHDGEDALPTRAPETGAFIGVQLSQCDLAGRNRGADQGVPALFRTAVAEVQAELRPRFGDAAVAALPVVFATDSDSPEWIRSVQEKYGWVYLNHSVWDREQDQIHPGWIPSVLDSAVLARGLGLVGTNSTLSSVAAARVESWQGGVSRLVNLTGVKVIPDTAEIEVKQETWEKEEEDDGAEAEEDDEDEDEDEDE